MAGLRTAAVLIKLAVDDERGLRLAESAGYNLREALRAVVAGRTPVDGGLPAILAAWDGYQLDVREPGVDRSAALAALEDVLRRVADGRDRSSYHGAQLLGYFAPRPELIRFQATSIPSASTTGCDATRIQSFTPSRRWMR